MQIVENFLLVFRNRSYILLSLAVAALIAFILGILMQIVFVSPRFIVTLVGVPVFDLVFLAFVSIVSGMTISMSIYRLKDLRAPLKTGNSVGFFGVVVSLFVSACACSTVLFTLLSVTGVVGTVAFGFIYQYLTPIRIVMMVILLFSFYYTAKNLMVGCKIKFK